MGVEVFPDSNFDFCKNACERDKNSSTESEKIAHQNLQKALLRSRKMNPDHEKWGLDFIKGVELKKCLAILKSSGLIF